MGQISFGKKHKNFYFEAQVADKRSWLQQRVCAGNAHPGKSSRSETLSISFLFGFNLLLGWQECGSAALVEIVKGVTYEATEVLSLNLIRLSKARYINHAEPLEPCDKSFELFKLKYFSFSFFICPCLQHIIDYWNYCQCLGSNGGLFVFCFVNSTSVTALHVTSNVESC